VFNYSALFAEIIEPILTLEIEYKPCLSVSIILLVEHSSFKTSILRNTLSKDSFYIKIFKIIN